MNSGPHYFLRRAALALALLLSIFGLLLTTSRAAAEGDRPAAPIVVPPIETTAYAASGSPANPFPTTTTMTDTVQAAVVELSQLPQPWQPPADALAVTSPPIDEIGAQAVRYRAFLPVTIRPRGIQPPPPPPAVADVAVTIWPKPSIRVIRGGVLSFEIRLANYGAGSADTTRVRVPYSRQQMALFSTAFAPGSGDWISANETDYVMVTFGPLASGARRSATLNFRVGAALATDTVINTRATASWSDGGPGGTSTTNWAPVLVGAGNADSAYLWLTVSPASGKAGTTHRFFTDRFIPGEGVIAWLNTPAGVKPLDLRTTADSYGRVWVDFGTAGRTPGSYGLVLYGARSNLTAVAGFTVLP